MRYTTGILLSAVLVGCGYSEDEWQAQLAKYGALDAQHRHGQAALQKAQQDLQAAMDREQKLRVQLKEMGLNLDNLEQKLEQEGSEKERLAANVNQLQQALDEYKQRAEQLERIKQRFEALRDKLKKLTNLGLKVQIRHNRMVISLPGDVLFASGQDKLRDEGIQVLAAVAAVIRNDAQLAQRYFQVAGHTDNMPLKGGTFKDNWGLSAMRARQVLVFLVAPVDAEGAGGGLNPGTLHAAGYGETDPIASNDSVEGRQTNRRVELVLMPDVSEMLDLKSMI